MINLKFKIEYILLVVLVLGMILILASFLKQLSFADNSREVQKGKRIEIRVNDALEQEFIAEDNGLSNLKILFGNRALRRYNYLKFTLADENCSKSIAEEILKGAYDLDSRYLYDFNFPKIDNSKNKKYCLQINLIAETDWSLWRKIRGKINSEKNSEIQKVRLFENGLSKNQSKYVVKSSEGDSEIQGVGAIVFRESYRSDILRQDFQQLNQRISQYKPWFLKGWWLVIIILLVTMLTVGTVWGIMVAKKQGVRDEL